MTLARIYPFFRKDMKMKLDRVKEEIANIRRMQNIIIACLIGMIGYVFTTKKMPIEFGILWIMLVVLFFFMVLVVLHYKMKDKLNELEKTGKDE